MMQTAGALHKLIVRDGLLIPTNRSCWDGLARSYWCKIALADSARIKTKTEAPAPVSAQLLDATIFSTSKYRTIGA
jgi:hypothetical protein